MKFFIAALFCALSASAFAQSLGGTEVLVNRYNQLSRIISNQSIPFDKRDEAVKEENAIVKELNARDMCILERSGYIAGQADTPPSDKKFVPCSRSSEILQSCRILGQIFMTTASARDDGYDPETAFQLARQYLSAKATGIDEQLFKKIVNSVYFEPGLARAGGYRLARQMEELCATGHDNGFQPLK